MNFVVLGRDAAGGEARARHRADHLRYVEGHQAKVVWAPDPARGDISGR